MPQYLGFSTKDACKPKTTNMVGGSAGGPGGIVKPVLTGKKYKLVDEALVMQDFLNALNIRRGTKVGQPGYGCKIWDFLFDPNTADVQFQLENEIYKIAEADNRIQLNYVKSYPRENGMLLEIELAIVPFNIPFVSNIYFDGAVSRAYQL